MEIAANKAIQEQLVESGFVECKKCGVWMYEGEFSSHKCDLRFIYKKGEQRPSTKGMTTFALPVYSREDLQKLKEFVSVAFTSSTGIRNKAYIVMGINTGLRGSDLISLRMEDFDLPFDGPEAFTAGMSFVINEKKTKKKRRIYLNQAAIDALVEWIEIRGWQSGYVFCSARGDQATIARNCHKKLTLDYFRFMLRKVGRKIGIVLKQRSLRKSFCYHAWKSGVRIEVLQEILGHYTTRDTFRYLGLESEEHVSAYNVEL